MPSSNGKRPPNPMGVPKSHGRKPPATPGFHGQDVNKGCAVVAFGLLVLPTIPAAYALVAWLM